MTPAARAAIDAAKSGVLEYLARPLRDVATMARLMGALGLRRGQFVDGLPHSRVLDRALQELRRAGKIRYLGVSNFSGWHLMKGLALAERHGWSRYVAHQAYYSLIGRDYEWELMPLALDQKIGTVVWSPLGWGKLTGKLRRGQALPETTRLQSKVSNDKGPPVPNEHVFKVVDAIDGIAKETGKTVTQIALNWLLQRPTISTIIVGARNEEQLR